MAVQRFRDPDYPRLFTLENIGQGHLQPSEAIRTNNSETNLYLPITFWYRDYLAWIVFVDGACSRNGNLTFATGGYGVYFGPNSSHNVSNPMKPKNPEMPFPTPTNQRAELKAALVALDRIQYHASQDDGFRGLWIIATDSAYVVDSITKWIYNWRDNKYTNSRGFEVVNRDLFEQLDVKLDIMAERQGIDVLFWKVDRDENGAANELARDGVEY